MTWAPVKAGKQICPECSHTRKNKRDRCLSVSRKDDGYTDVVDGVRVVEDAKGMAARDWPIRKALFKVLNPHLELREV